MSWPTRVLLCATVLAAACASPATDDAVGPEGDAVLATAQELFDILGSRDTLALREVMAPEGRFVAVTPDGGVRVVPLAQITAMLDGTTVSLEERMWDPVVRINGPIATVWTPYDFHRGGEFSHCGIDAFHLVRSGGRWRITEVMYSVQPEDCDPGPEPY